MTSRVNILLHGCARCFETLQRRLRYTVRTRYHMSGNGSRRVVVLVILTSEGLARRWHRQAEAGAVEWEVCPALGFFGSHSRSPSDATLTPPSVKCLIRAPCSLHPLSIWLETVPPVFHSSAKRKRQGRHFLWPRTNS